MARTMLTAFEGLLADTAGICPTLLWCFGGSASIAAGIHGIDGARDCKSFHEFRVLTSGMCLEEFARWDLGVVCLDQARGRVRR